MADSLHKVLIFLKRRPGMSLDEFRDYYENHHMPLCLKYGTGMQRYVRRYIEHPRDPESGEPRELEYDVVTEIWFADRSLADAVLLYAGQGKLPRDVIEDEERLFDRAKSRFVRVTECDTELA